MGTEEVECKNVLHILAADGTDAATIGQVAQIKTPAVVERYLELQGKAMPPKIDLEDCESVHCLLATC